MCNPALIAAAAMQAGSMYMNNEAQNDVTRQRNRAAQGEAARQRDYQQRADQVNTATQDRFDRDSQEQGVAEQAAAREQFIQASLPDDGASGMNLMPETTSSTVRSDLGRRIADALSYGRDMASKQAMLGAFGTNQFNNQIQLGRTGLQLSQLGNTSARSSDITGLELEAANQAGAGKRALGDILRLGGQTAMSYGMAQPATASSADIGTGFKATGGTGLKATGGIGLKAPASGLGLRFS